MNSIGYLLLTCCVCLFTPEVRGHGRLREPPSRSSMWRDGFNTPINYNDNELNCGGFFYQSSVVKGRCGVCGDPYGRNVAANEAGGKYANDVVVRNYTRGQVIPIVAEITTQHGGWFEVRICPVDVNSAGKGQKVDLACLDANVLQKSDGSGGRTYMGRNDKEVMHSAEVMLPNDLTCKRCVIQWKWKAGNSWGVDKNTGRGCVGCGDQEEFYGCADVSISEGNDDVPQATTIETTKFDTEKVNTDTSFDDKTWKTVSVKEPDVDTTNVKSTTTVPSSSGSESVCKTTSKGPNRFLNLDQWCSSNCKAGHCPVSHCECTDVLDNGKTCVTTSKGPYRFLDLDDWCRSNCAQGYCPKTHCECKDAVTKPSQDDSTQQIVRVCGTTSKGPYRHMDFDDWCTANCDMGYCPKSHCECRDEIRSKYNMVEPGCRTTNRGPFKNMDFDDWCKTNCEVGFCPKSHCKCY